MYRTFWEYRWSLKITLMVLLNYFLFLIIFSSCLLTRTHTLYVILNNLFFTTNDGKRNKNVVLSRQKKVIIESHKRKLHTAILAHFLSLEKYTLLLIKYFPSLQNKSKFSFCRVIFATHRHHLYSSPGR